MRKLLLIGIIALAVIAIAGCKTLSEEEYREQIKQAEKAQGG